MKGEGIRAVQWMLELQGIVGGVRPSRAQHLEREKGAGRFLRRLSIRTLLLPGTGATPSWKQVSELAPGVAALLKF